VIFIVDLENLIDSESNIHAKRFYQLLLEEDYGLVEGAYKNSATKIKIIHFKCSYSWEVRPNHFKKKDGKLPCPRCSGRERLNTDLFKSRVYELVGNEYEVIGEYINSDTPIKMKHSDCGIIEEKIPYNFFYGFRCGSCSGNIKRTKKQFEQEVYKQVGKEYRVISDYINRHTDIELRHMKCGSSYHVTPHNFLNHEKRCPHCQSSKGEKLTESILKENNFTYIPQDRFEECRNKYPLPFDFGVYDNDELIALIEYQGRQHYEPVDFAGRGVEWAQENFEKVQHNDNIKRKFCKENNIPLIEIKYSLTDKQVSDFLLSELNEVMNYEKVS